MDDVDYKMRPDENPAAWARRMPTDYLECQRKTLNFLVGKLSAYGVREIHLLTTIELELISRGKLPEGEGRYYGN